MRATAKGTYAVYMNPDFGKDSAPTISREIATPMSIDFVTSGGIISVKLEDDGISLQAPDGRLVIMADTANTVTVCTLPLSVPCWVCGGKRGEHTPDCDQYLYEQKK